MNSELHSKNQLLLLDACNEVVSGSFLIFALQVFLLFEKQNKERTSLLSLLRSGKSFYILIFINYSLKIFGKGKIIKCSVISKLMTYRLVVNAQTYCTTLIHLYEAKFWANNCIELLWTLLFISISMRFITIWRYLIPP